MASQIKDVFYGVLAFLNVLVCVLFLLVGFSDRLNPVEYPLLACAGLFFPFLIVAVFAFLVLWIVVFRRYVLISLITLIVGISPLRTYTPITRPGQLPGGKDLHIVSYNIDNFKGDTLCEESSEIVEYLEACGADIVCLQEAQISDSRLNELKNFFSYIDNSCIPEGTHLTTLSKHPILKTEFIEYESTGNGSVCLYIKYHDDTLRVINNHLESTKIPEEERSVFEDMVKGETNNLQMRQESKQLLRTLSDAMIRRAPQVEALAKFIGENSRNTIFVGDMNDTPISYAHYCIGQVLRDCYKSSGNLWGFSYKKNQMWVRIDHSFCSEDWIPDKCFVDNSIGASDHYPIVTYLKKD